MDGSCSRTSNTSQALVRDAIAQHDEHLASGHLLKAAGIATRMTPAPGLQIPRDMPIACEWCVSSWVHATAAGTAP